MSLFSKTKKLFVALLLTTTMLTPIAFGASRDKPEKNPKPVVTTYSDTPIDQYPGRVNGKLPGLSVITADQPEKEVPPPLSLAWYNMQRLKNSETITGPLIYDFAARAKVFLYQNPTVGVQWDTEDYISKLSPDTAALVRRALEDLHYTDTARGITVATWEDDRGLLTIGPITDTSFMLCAQVHELVHSVQRTTGVKEPNMSWPIWEFQSCLLSHEAAASASEKIIALELYYAQKMEEELIKAGKRPYEPRSQSEIEKDKGPWIYCMFSDGESLYRTDSAFRSALTNNTSYIRALEESGRAAFYRQFEVQWWLDGYNESVFYHYLDWIMQNQLKAPSQDEYGLNKMSMTGYISPEFNFTARIDSIPSNMFGDNDKMRQAFDWMNLLHIGQTCGQESARYQEALKKLEKSENPYLGVDARLLYLTLEASRYTLPLTAVLDYYSPSQKSPVFEKQKERLLHPR